MSQRFEMRLSDELAQRIDQARGSTPKATWIKQALESTLSAERGSSQAPSRGGPATRDSDRGSHSASTRTPVEPQASTRIPPHKLGGARPTAGCPECGADMVLEDGYDRWVCSDCGFRER